MKGRRKRRCADNAKPTCQPSDKPTNSSVGQLSGPLPGVLGHGHGVDAARGRIGGQHLDTG
jgi:hypothetical protein